MLPGIQWSQIQIFSIGYIEMDDMFNIFLNGWQSNRDFAHMGTEIVSNDPGCRSATLMCNTACQYEVTPPATLLPHVTSHCTGWFLVNILSSLLPWTTLNEILGVDNEVYVILFEIKSVLYC